MLNFRLPGFLLFILLGIPLFLCGAEDVPNIVQSRTISSTPFTIAVTLTPAQGKRFYHSDDANSQLYFYNGSVGGINSAMSEQGQTSTNKLETTASVQYTNNTFTITVNWEWYQKTMWIYRSRSRNRNRNRNQTQ